MKNNQSYLKMRYIIVFLSLLTFFQSATGASAATKEQAERARMCGFSDENIEFSINAEPILAKMDETVTSVDRGTGPIRVIYFFDYKCNSCKLLHSAFTTTMNIIEDVRVSYIETPIADKQSRRAARRGILLAQEADAETYFAYHEALLQRTTKLNRKAINTALGKAGINPSNISDRISSSNIDDTLDNNQKVFRKLGFRRSPGVIIDGIITNVDIEMFRKIECMASLQK